MLFNNVWTLTEPTTAYMLHEMSFLKSFTVDPKYAMLETHVLKLNSGKNV